MSFKLEIPGGARLDESSSVSIVTKFDFKYEEYLQYLDYTSDLVRNNKRKQIFIVCSHPEVLTIGQGNERNVEGLKPLLPIESHHYTNFEVHKIKRGGGLTFHHPGQVIIYPVVKINPSMSLELIQKKLLKIAKETLEACFQFQDSLLAANKLVGIWHKRKKLASIGLGNKKYISQHGLALNFFNNKPFSNRLANLTPCGLDFNTYTTVEELVGNLKEEDREGFLKLLYKEFFKF